MVIPILIRGALVGVATAVALNLGSDPDLWGHLRFGLDFWSTLAVPTVDPYSFTSDRAWINHEWLFEALIALVYTLGGTVALAMMAAIVTLAALAIARGSARRADLEGWRLDALTAVMFLIGVAPLVQTMRPQVASVLLFVSLLALLREFDRGRHRALLAVPPLFLVWANMHGAWVVGGAALAIWVASGLSTTLVASGSHPTSVASGLSTTSVASGLSRKLQTLMPVSIGVVSAAATFVNPYGLELWRFLLETLRFERADIVEWGPLTSAPIMLIPWIITVVVAVAGSARVRREHLAYVAVCAFLGLASFRVMRLVPFFSVATLMLLGPLLAGRPARKAVQVDVRGWAGATLIGVICVVSSTLGEPRLGCLRPAGAFYVDSRAASFLQENKVTGRLLVWFDWGEYVLWHLGPSLQVSMEGRRETTYTATTLAAHAQFYQNGPGAREYLERLAPDYVWLPKSLPISAVLAGWGWQPIFETDKSTVWARGKAHLSWRPPRPTTTSCFPAA